MQKNKYFQRATYYVAAFGSAALIGSIAAFAKQRFTKTISDRQKNVLEEKVSSDVLDILSQDESYLNIVVRIAEYEPICPDAFEELVRAIVPVIKFLNTTRKTITMQDNKDYVLLGHVVIDATRIFRTMLEMKMPNVLEDFDEVATDIQAKYDEDRESMLFDAQLRW